MQQAQEWPLQICQERQWDFRNGHCSSALQWSSPWAKKYLIYFPKLPTRYLPELSPHAQLWFALQDWSLIPSPWQSSACAKAQKPQHWVAWWSIAFRNCIQLSWAKRPHQSKHLSWLNSLPHHFGVSQSPDKSSDCNFHQSESFFGHAALSFAWAPRCANLSISAECDHFTDMSLLASQRALA